MSGLNPKSVVEKWIEAFNQKDAKKITLLYHKDSVNHQVAEKPVIGQKDIGEMFTEQFASAEMTCIVENLFQDGDWAILEWRDPLGLRGCGFFYIINGKIKLQRGYWDKLSFLRQHGFPLPDK